MNIEKVLMFDDISDEMRRELDQAFVKKFGFGRLSASTNSDAFQMLKAAEWAWQASRAALAIELPGVTYKQNPDYETDIELPIRQEMREKIEAAGVKVKS